MHDHFIAQTHLSTGYMYIISNLCKIDTLSTGIGSS